MNKIKTCASGNLIKNVLFHACYYKTYLESVFEFVAHERIFEYKTCYEQYKTLIMKFYVLFLCVLYYSLCCCEVL